VAVTVFNHPELTFATVTIDGDGKLAMPLAGNVVVAGLEPDAAAAHIGDALKSYLRAPVVSIAVVQQNATISIVGGPTSSLPFVPGQTLSSIVATLAATPGLDLHHVVVQRDGAKLGSYDGLDLLRHAEAGPALAPGDQVIVAQKPVAVNVVGVVHTAGIVYLDRGASIADAVSAAGGAMPDGATGAVDVLRGGVHQHVALSSEAGAQPVQDGDQITVPQAVHVAVGGQVGHPGETVLTNGTTLIAAIYEAGGPLRYSDLNHTEVLHDGVRHVYDVSKVPQGDSSQNPHLSEGDIVNVPTGGHLNLGDIFGGAGIIHWFF
jgi:protein involved in polysaccharide export with SLBB domain